MPFQIKPSSGVFHVIGRIDERSDLAVLDSVGDGALKLNLFALDGMSSIGTMTFLNFVRRRGARPLEFHECQRWFVETANVLPDTLGGRAYSRRLVSLYAPFRCDSCQSKVEALVQAAGVKVMTHGVELPKQRCVSCGQTMRLVDVMAEDYFLFLIDAQAAA